MRRMINSSVKGLLVPSLIVAVVVCLLTVNSALAIRCSERSGKCTAELSLSVWDGIPTVICLKDVPVVEIIVTVKCKNSAPCTERVLKCGISTDGFSFTCGKVTHKFGLEAGAQWQDALRNCKVIEYKAGKGKGPKK